jgi:hypothetical protein
VKPEIKVHEVLDRGECPFCTWGVWFRVRTEDDRLMVMHTEPGCATFRHSPADIFYKAAKQAQPS